MEELKSLIREVPDFPKPGISFKDITTLVGNAGGLRRAIACLAEPFREARIDKVVGIESRGFIFGAAVADRLGAGFVPASTVRVEYALEYGTDALEIHEDAIGDGERVLIVDDLLATGGTARATADLVTKRGARVLAFAFLVELDALGGRERLAGHDIFAAVHY